jgi:capsular polysaccharide biosynthesis protein
LSIKPLWIALRGGWWIVVGSIVIVVAAAAAVESARSIDYRSTVVLSVPPSLGRAEAGDVGASSALAGSLRQIIPSDVDVQRNLAQELGIDRDTAANGIDVSQPGDSTVLRLTYRAGRASAALEGAEALARATRAAAGNGDIPADSIRILELPRDTRFAAGREQPYSAAAVVVVRDPAAASAVMDADGARRLATTYAILVSEDDAVLRAVRRAVERAGEAADGLEIEATNETDTSILDVSVTGPDRMAVLSGARAVARALTGPDPASANIVPRSLSTVRVPDAPPAAQAASSATTTLIAAGVAGLLLGLVALVGWERRQRRVAHGRDVTRLLDVPASAVSLDDGDAGGDLVRQWTASGSRPPAVALVPADGRARRSAEALADALGRGEAPLPAVIAPLRANGNRSEPPAHALTVLVARGGTPSDDLVDAFDDAVAQGRRPGWAVLAD